MAKVCFVSIDIEEDYGREGAEGIKSLDKILTIFEKYGVKATFFITGVILEKYQAKWTELSSVHDGSVYEIACHGGMSHRFWPELSKEERSKELNSFEEIYKGIFQKKPVGFRAPSHLVDNEAITLLIENGFKYDASVVPHYPFFTHYRGYKGKAPRKPYYPSPTNLRQEQKLAVSASGKTETGSRSILEVPSTGLLMGVPLAGTWIRKLPLFCFRLLLLIKKPQFLTLSLHSWDSLSQKTLEKLAAILEILSKDYDFRPGRDIKE